VVLSVSSQSLYRIQIESHNLTVGCNHWHSMTLTSRSVRNRFCICWLWHSVHSCTHIPFRSCSDLTRMLAVSVSLVSLVYFHHTVSFYKDFFKSLAWACTNQFSKLLVDRWLPDFHSVSILSLLFSDSAVTGFASLSDSHLWTLTWRLDLWPRSCAAA